MLTTLALSAALLAPAAPAPNSAPNNAPTANETAPAAAPGGLPPRIVELKPNQDGKVLITVMRQQKIQPPVAAPGANPGRRAFGGVGGVFNRPEQVELSEVKDLKITTAGGKEVSKEDAIKALTKGGKVVVAADGKAVSSDFLKMFKDDVLVLSSPELAMGANYGGIGGGGIIQVGPQRIVPANGPNIRPPAPPAPPAPKQN